jgi:threonine 3-dehydrogenase
MRAIRKVGASPGLELCEVPVPTPAADEVLVEVEAASICGTDLHINRWDEWARRRIRPPLTLGHELCGTVVERGALVRHVEIGDFVSAESHVTCGMCFHCRTGNAHLCEATEILGVDRDGAFAEYVCIPEKVVWPNDRAKLPPEIATLQEPFGNAVFAAGEQDLAGRGVAVLGCGPVGLFTTAIARASGAAVVLAADRHRFRLALAERMGATDVVDVAETDDVADWFRDHHEGRGFDVVFEMSGAPEAIGDAFSIVRNGGRVILFGIPASPVELDVAEKLIFKNVEVLALSGRRIFGTWYKTRWLLESGVVDLTPLVTHELPLEQFAHAFDELETGEACKIVLYPRSGRLPDAATDRIETRERDAVAALRGSLARWSHR